MPIQFGESEALDIIEGVVAGGLISVATDIIASAVSYMPGSFLTTTMVLPLSMITGALTFVGIALHNIRARRQI